MERDHPWQYGPVILNSPATIAATDYYDSLKKFSYPGYTNFTWDDAVAQMRQGHIFMCLMWSDAMFHVLDPKTSSGDREDRICPAARGEGRPCGRDCRQQLLRIALIPKIPPASFAFVLVDDEARPPSQPGTGKGVLGEKIRLRRSRVMQLPYAPATAQSLAVGKTMTDTIPEGTPDRRHHRNGGQRSSQRPGILTAGARCGQRPRSTVCWVVKLHSNIPANPLTGGKPSSLPASTLCYI